jgi:hypothetical protein
MECRSFFKPEVAKDSKVAKKRPEFQIDEPDARVLMLRLFSNGRMALCSLSLPGRGRDEGPNRLRGTECLGQRTA